MTATDVYQQARLSRDPRFDGSFFVAVKTTKIFCRTICPATLPLEKNVEYFVMAQQAMQHGYRPCLRCRPDSAPHSNAWQGVLTTVNRASHLLHSYHELSISEIAEKLGIGDRYFRQLFQAQLGISPKQFQLFDQILFAKHLLHQSNLSIEQVAQSSGFNNARRLQIQMKKATGLSPSQVRKQQRTIDQDIQLTMAFRPPYNWPHLRDFMAVRAITMVEEINADSYARFFTLGDCKGWFQARFDEPNNQFKLRIKLDNIKYLTQVLRNIERVLDVSADMQAIQQQLKLSGIPDERLTEGLRLPGIWNPFEAGCRAILGQQISVKAAINLVTQLVCELGEKSLDVQYFPKAENILNHDLSFLKIPESRRQTLRDFATWCHHHLDGEIDDWFTIKGIGAWTIAYAKLRGLSSPDIWLESDLVIKNQLKIYSIDSEQARPWRSYLTLQLWNLA
ncbi:AlkA N-terminal domain-containing protein [Paraglaciecola sp.]|uniref:AlkA N-terminal domain-containing protein n=1 Tax=Paraglaciecola sp. TaxID=1920173 RepID=UPI0030F37A01